MAGALCALLLPSVSGSTGSAKSGGIFRVTFLTTPGNFDHVDPALAYSRESWALLDTVCARLMRYRDRPPPQGYELEPDVAAAPPVVSRDGRTWTFRLRKGFRFSDGSPVRADAFAQAIHRTMAPGVDSPAYLYTRAIVGAEDVYAGRAERASGVTARDYTLTVRFTRAVREFAHWTTMPFFCAVPPALPPSPEGVRTFPGAGPYTIREYRPNQRIVLGRNRYYGGRRAHHVDGFHVDLSAESPDEKIKRVATGRADWTYTLPAVALQSHLGLIDKFGLNYSQFFITPGLTISMYVFNSSGPLFRNNPQLRRAVNLALDRGRLVRRPAPATRPTSICHRTYLASSSARSTRLGPSPAHERWRPGISAAARPSSMFPTSWLRAPPLRGSSFSWRSSGSRSRSGPSGSTRPRRPTSGGSATPTSPGTWRSCSGRPTSSTPPHTSTACSTGSMPAARTWPASTSHRTTRRCSRHRACEAQPATRPTPSWICDSPGTPRRSCRSPS